MLRLTCLTAVTTLILLGGAAQAADPSRLGPIRSVINTATGLGNAAGQEIIPPPKVGIPTQPAQSRSGINTTEAAPPPETTAATPGHGTLSLAKPFGKNPKHRTYYGRKSRY